MTVACPFAPYRVKMESWVSMETWNDGVMGRQPHWLQGCTLTLGSRVMMDDGRRRRAVDYVGLESVSCNRKEKRQQREASILTVPLRRIGSPKARLKASYAR